MYGWMVEGVGWCFSVFVDVIDVGNSGIMLYFVVGVAVF